MISIMIKIKKYLKTRIRKTKNILHLSCQQYHLKIKNYSKIRKSWFQQIKNGKKGINFFRKLKHKLTNQCQKLTKKIMLISLRTITFLCLNLRRFIDQLIFILLLRITSQTFSSAGLHETSSNSRGFRPIIYDSEEYQFLL